ncbi:hypothetical protein EKO23_16925 [Nocardioides guangzhouensis]|uniref:Uncharacterized protein n=2 Tax=Nocardioides guangzhouensis TaxID=2497878 RepID=A0A4Q4Z8H1_9ACTN|nr:hypothetical protein EKO23_16925 [Nocardioides guangzhouensis]
MPVLSRGKHRNPRRGACFMEMASVLAGERWSDHPSCTHPLLAQLARQVNDNTNDADRQHLVHLIPSVVGRRGDADTWLAVAVAVATTAILDVPETRQRALAGGLLQAERLCAGHPGREPVRRQARAALDSVPGAVAWVDQLGLRNPISEKTFARLCAPTMVRCAVEGVVTTGRPDTDRRLRSLLEAGIAACPAPEPEPVSSVVPPRSSGARPA